MPIPQFLYRGDRDSLQVRQLRATWASGHLLTNLSAGGRGREIFNAPLIASINRHVDLGWAKTHFLSFSTERLIAERFARGTAAAGGALVALPPTAGDWETSVLTLDASRLTLTPVLNRATGFYWASFPDVDHRPPSAIPTIGSIARAAEHAARAGAIVRVLLIDVVEALTAERAAGNTTVGGALEKASNDRKWLILPLDPFPDDPRELTATLDDACISLREKFNVA